MKPDGSGGQRTAVRPAGFQWLCCDVVVLRMLRRGGFSSLLVAGFHPFPVGVHLVRLAAAFLAALFARRGVVAGMAGMGGRCRDRCRSREGDCVQKHDHRLFSRRFEKLKFPERRVEAGWLRRARSRPDEETAGATGSTESGLPAPSGGRPSARSRRKPSHSPESYRAAWRESCLAGRHNDPSPSAPQSPRALPPAGSPSRRA